MSYKENNANYGSTMSTDEPSTFIKVAKAFFTFLIIGLSVFLAYSGATGISSLAKDTKSDQQAQVVFMGIYIILFSALLFTFELLQICSCCEALDTMYKKNFGFFYGVVGKSCYMILIGIFAFGLDVSGTSQKINYSAAILMAATGFLAIIIHCVNPNFFDKKEKYRP